MALIERHSNRPGSAPPRQLAALWGWYRAALGIVQMALAVWAAFLFLTEGLTHRTLIVAAGGLCALVLSRILFRGRKGSTLDRR